jgi:hypothetical protein
VAHSWDGATLAKHVAAVKAATTTTDKGRTLEDLLTWFFAQFDGITVGARNLGNDAEELDLVLFNDQLCPVLRAWGHEILVEAKNWSTPVDAMAVNWFLTKLRTRGVRNGLVVARMGVTGMAHGHGGAVEAIKNSLSEGFRPIVLTLANLEQVQGREAFFELLRAKQCQLLMGQVV